MMTLRSSAVVLSAVLALALNGCGDNEKKSQNNDSKGQGQKDPSRISSPLTMDLTRPVQKKLALGTGSSVRETIEAHASKLMAPSHGKWLAPASWPHYASCEAAYAEALTVAAIGDSLTLKGTVDISECVQIRNEPIERGQIQVYAKLTCKGKDLSSFNGLALSDVSGMPCADATDVSFIAQSVVDMKGELRLAGLVPVEITVKEQHSIADGNGQGCRYAGQAKKLGYDRSCQAIAKIQYDSPHKLPVIGLPLNKVTYLKATFNDVPFVADQAMPWYESRKAKVEVDGWDGEVEYQGVNSSPRYRLKRGVASVDGAL